VTSPDTDLTPGVVFVQTVIPDYRVRFFRALEEELGPQLLLVSGEDDWGRDLPHVDGIAHATARNRFFLRRRLLWQSDVVRTALAARVAILNLNPRILSTWVVLLGRRLRGRRTVLWGHVWPRAGQASRTEHVRGVMRRLANVLVVYTESEAMLARSLRGSHVVVAAPNALYSRAELGAADPPERTTDFVCVGRLIDEKRPQLVLDAFERALEELPDDTKLVFVGDGPRRGSLEAAVEARGLVARVVFRGRVSALDDLRRVYEPAIASVSPGTAGLSVIQSLGFGVPVIVTDDARHGPEIEATVEGENAVFFDGSSPDALERALVAVAAGRDEWRARRPTIAGRLADRYTIEAMAAAFAAAVRT
jgi:glycosyltransferase involved in cell wall biosynthesis